MKRDPLARPEPSGQNAALASGWARIWDLPTRLFHWLLVFCAVVAGKTGFFGPASGLDWHVWAGYGIGVLVVWRLIWGLLGSEYSRLDRLFGALRNLPEHIDGLRKLEPKHYAGHNPAGSLMILGLLVVLLGITATGIVVLGGVEKQGMLAGLTSYNIGHLTKGVHQVLAYGLVAMVLGHIGGVISEIVLLRVPLIRGMITGWLPLAEDSLLRGSRPARPTLALIWTAVTAAVIAGLTLPLAAMPGLGVPAPVTNPTFLKECAACHWAIHPSLLPRSSWKLIMSSLDQHFGEDASLPPAAAADIGTFLEANAAETVDTEPANRLREVSANEPKRITATGFWQHMHHDIRDQTFTSPAVKSKINCVACHKDAPSGRFDDQVIDIPHKSQTGDSQ